MKEITVQSDLKNLPGVTAFINETLNALNCSKKTKVRLAVAIDEIIANIAMHAYGAEQGPIHIQVDYGGDPKAVVIIFSDYGKPFNPLGVSDPDVTLPLKDRPIGGLGIFMLKNSVDDIQYEYKDEQNILTIRKTI